MKKKCRITRREVSRTVSAVEVFSDSIALSVDLFKLGRLLDMEGDYAAGYTCKEGAVSLQGMFATMERMREVIRILAKYAPPEQAEGKRIC